MWKGIKVGVLWPLENTVNWIIGRFLEFCKMVVEAHFSNKPYVGRNSDRLQRDKQTVCYIWGAGVYHFMCNIQKGTYSLVHVLLKTQMHEFDSDWCLSFNSLTITLRESNTFKSLIMSNVF